MTGPVDERSASDEWMLLRDVRAFVAQHCGGSDDAAENLILEYAAQGYFKSCRWHQEEPSGPFARGIASRSWGFASPLLGLYIPVDFANSTVTWMRGEAGNCGLTAWVEDKLEAAGHLPPYDYFQITLVRLRRSDVLSMLQKVGLWEAPLAAAAAVQVLVEEAPEKSLVAAAVVQDSVLETPEKPLPTGPKLTRKGWLERRHPLDKAAAWAAHYDTITKATEAIHEEMKNDPDVEPYASARQIEPYFAGMDLWPGRRSKR